MSLSVNVEKTLGNFHLRANFETEDGILALLGASGCGKSMTLKCIAGIVKPDKGRIELDGRVLFDSEKKINLPPQERQVGYLFQQYALFPNMTARQNILAGAKRLPRAERKPVAEDLIRRLRLEGLENKRPGQLSGGQQQRVALARILASRPRVILLDEPFSALDSFLRWQMELELMETLEAFDGPVVWVSHDRDEVYRRCARVCVMDQGRTAPVADMKQMFQSPQTVTAARLSGCKNFTPLEAVGGQTISLPRWHIRLDCGRPIPPEATVLGLRSHYIGPQFGENRFPCRVEQVIENVFSMVVLVRPLEADKTCPALRLELDKDTWNQYARQEILEVGIAPGELLLLREEDAT